MVQKEVQMISMAEVAKQFGVTVERVWQWTFDGCPSKNVSGTPMFWLSDVIRWKRQVTK